MENHNISDKIYILLQQKNYHEAEKLAKELLAGDPNNVEYLARYAEACLYQEKLEDAQQAIDSAIGLQPDNPALYYIKSQVCAYQERIQEAEKYINQAIEMDPWTADYLAYAAHIKILLKDYEASLNLADQALEIDPEDVFALNARSTALLKLKRKDESFDTIQGALHEDPNNTYTHSNYGWGLLEKGDHKKALEHFKEALQADPENEHAQTGLLEALKARNPIYKLFLKYAFFMSNLSSKYQWGVIIAIYVLFRVLRTIARENESIEPFLTPIIIGFAILVLSTWIINPLSNLFLRLNKYGKLLLDKKEKLSSNFVALSLLIFLTGIGLYLSTFNDIYLTIVVFGFAMMLPLGNMFSSDRRQGRFVAFTIALAALGMISIYQSIQTGELFNAFSVLFIFGFAAFQFMMNYVLIREAKVE